MKIAIYSPYLDTFGGGERYVLTIAEGLSKKHSVDLLFDKHLYSVGADNLKSDLGKRFDLDLSKVNNVKAPVGKGSNALERLSFFKKYDILFYLTDGSIFYPTAGKCILHIQSPLIGQPAKSLWGKLKLRGWDLIIYNSKFTKMNSQTNWPIKSKVIYPPVDTNKIKLLKKKKYILSVGRFFGYLKDKKQEILIKAFKDLFKSGKLNGWSLHLVGSAGKGDESYMKNLKSMAKGLPINFYPNLSYIDLVKLYGESSIYWHAAGFKENDPIKMEHFGIATVEAMAGGCVPIVINAGGQTEIVVHKKNGYLWNTIKELVNFTEYVIRNNQIFRKLSNNAILRSRLFDKDKFETNIEKIIFMLT